MRGGSASPIDGGIEMPELKRGKRRAREPVSRDAVGYSDRDAIVGNSGTNSVDRSANHPRSVQALDSFENFQIRDEAQQRQEPDLEAQRDRPKPPRWR